MTPKTASDLSGRATGAIIFSCFGAAWIGLGLFASHRLSALWVVLLVVVLLALLGAAAFVFRQIAGKEQAPEDPEQKRVFNLVNGLQWGAIILSVLLLPRFHGEVFTVPVIAFIVGLHLFPLARSFRYPLHYVTGTLLVVWSVVCCFLVPRPTLSSTAALGAGFILWLSAGSTLFLAMRAARKYKKKPPENPAKEDKAFDAACRAVL